MYSRKNVSRTLSHKRAVPVGENGNQIHTLSRSKKNKADRPNISGKKRIAGTHRPNTAMTNTAKNADKSLHQAGAARAQTPKSKGTQERKGAVAKRHFSKKASGTISTSPAQKQGRSSTSSLQTRAARHPAVKKISTSVPKPSVLQPDQTVMPEVTSNTSEVIGGRNAVSEALRAGRPISKLFVQESSQGGSLGQIIHLAKDAGVPVEQVLPAKLAALLPGVRHQGVAAITSPVTFSSLDAVIDQAHSRGEQPFLLLLDELQDPQNVGALIRTADAAGVHGVLLPSRHSCPLNAVVAKTSAGAVEYVPVVRIGNVTQTLEQLKEKGFWIVGADMAGKICYGENLTGPIVVVIGAEGKGLGRLVRENCDILVRLPMFGGVNSLNASAAGAVLLYEVVRQRLAREK